MSRSGSEKSRGYNTPAVMRDSFKRTQYMTEEQLWAEYGQPEEMVRSPVLNHSPEISVNKFLFPSTQATRAATPDGTKQRASYRKRNDSAGLWKDHIAQGHHRENSRENSALSPVAAGAHLQYSHPTAAQLGDRVRQDSYRDQDQYTSADSGVYSYVSSSSHTNDLHHKLPSPAAYSKKNINSSDMADSGSNPRSPLSPGSHQTLRRCAGSPFLSDSPTSFEEYVQDRHNPYLDFIQEDVEEKVEDTAFRARSNIGVYCTMQRRRRPQKPRTRTYSDRAENDGHKGRESPSAGASQRLQNFSREEVEQRQEKSLPSPSERALYSTLPLRSKGHHIPQPSKQSSGASRGDEPDYAKPLFKAPLAAAPGPGPKRVSSAPAAGRRSVGSARPPTGSGGSTGSSAGAVDEELFTRSFEEGLPKVQLFSARDLNDIIMRIKERLSDGNLDWEKRVHALKELRACIVAGAVDYDDFFMLLRQMEPCFIVTVKDLRSQVVREGCIDISFLAQTLCNKFDHFAESLLPSLINLIPNSVKIMATSGITAIKFIIQYTHANRLIPIITANMTSKSSTIRRYCCEFLEQMLRTWPTHTLEKHIAILQDAIKRGIGDADADARVYSRKAFWGFSDHFSEQANALLNTLDPSKQKLLQGELSNSSSSNSLNSGGVSKVGRPRTTDGSYYSSGCQTLPLPKRKARSRSPSAGRYGTVGRSPSAGRTPGAVGGAKRSVTPSVTSPRSDTTDGTLGADSGGGIVRSSSAVDLAGSSGKPRSSIARLTTTSNPSSLHVRKRPLKQVKSADYSNSSDSRSPGRQRDIAKSCHNLTILPTIVVTAPSSRSGSPSSRLSYLTHIPSRVDSNASGGTSKPRRSGIPRSQGASREASPSRISYGRDRRLSGSRHAPQRVPTKQAMGQHVSGQDIEQALEEALLKGNALRKRYDLYDSDDAGSETSSVCSERSYGSSYGRTSEDIQEILTGLTSGSWAERKEALLHLQNLLQGMRMLNRVELKKMTDIFSRMFHDPHGKVFSLFLEVLAEFVHVHKDMLHDWLFVLITRLLQKLGADMLGSVYTKVQRALDAVRDNFRYDQQFNIITKFIIDQTQTPNLKLKVKTGLLQYLQGLVLLMDPADFTSTSDTRLAVSRIITWTTEPKSAEVRKAAQSVLIALFSLNTPEFSSMLSVLPKTFQDGATKILHNHLRSANSETEVLSPRNVASPPARSSPKYKTSPRTTYEGETENMNPEDIYNSIRKTSADIQNLSYNSKLDHHPYDDFHKARDSTSQDSGIQSSLPDVRGESPEANKGKTHYDPAIYKEENQTPNRYDRAALEEAVFDVENELLHEGFSEVHLATLLQSLNIPASGRLHKLPTEQNDAITEILTELSNHNKRQEERKSAMWNLLKMTREGTVGIWEEHFKTILLLLLETLGDSDFHIRAMAVRVLREIVRNQPHRFKEYTELTILKILDAHKDPEREVVRAAEECAMTLAKSIPTEQSLRVLMPIVQTSEYPVNLAAIKMETKVIEQLSKAEMMPLVADVATGLLKGYDNVESSVRKASVFCLVAVYMSIGEELRPYLTELNGSKMKLLNLYIKRAQSQKENGGSPLKVASPSSAEAASD
ncbi:CLIP-associating protein 2 isoform X3 [Lingula anatina]|uniref:CLIP-associating protein 2 isoform X3 n=1 Tax=Lingula anatina TaxID=7574 RepID=A0A1S3HDX8_LINAN|nr:CLIP-associating protein 2 isoform X3 [Lingula anatina]|eukprot:XP_013383701.1 CLIP-associating protein 2 isoform X3 [Lingula anatina]